VYVSGAPGSGKSSLAVPLAAELGYPLLAKDRIKETLHDALGAPEPDRAWSRRLGGAAMELLWALAADAPAVVIEANFRPRLIACGPSLRGTDPVPCKRLGVTGPVLLSGCPPLIVNSLEHLARMI
jgi:hypothetical protein